MTAAAAAEGAEAGEGKNQNLINEIKIIILADNIDGARAGFKKDPGFSAAIETGGKIILFDTGMYPGNLSNNLNAAGRNAGDIDAVILSHNHNDHTDGLPVVLDKNPEIPVYIHKNWEQEISFQGMDIPGRNSRIVKKPGIQAGLPENILITAPEYSLDYGGVNEQAVIVRLKESFILICGCCHPGLIKYLNQRKILGINTRDPFQIIGGMHNFSFSDSQADEIKSKIKAVILCHCTQNAGLFKKQFGDKCEISVLGEKYEFK